MKKALLFFTFILSLFFISCGNMVDIYSKKNGRSSITIKLPETSSSSSTERSILTDDTVLTNLKYKVEATKGAKTVTTNPPTLSEEELRKVNNVVTLSVTPGEWTVTCSVFADGFTNWVAFSETKVVAEVGVNKPANLTLVKSSAERISSVELVNENALQTYTLGDEVVTNDVKFKVTYQNDEGTIKYSLTYPLSYFGEDSYEVCAVSDEDKTKSIDYNYLKTKENGLSKKVVASRFNYYLRYVLNVNNKNILVDGEKNILIRGRKPVITKQPQSTYLVDDVKDGVSRNIFKCSVDYLDDGSIKSDKILVTWTTNANIADNSKNSKELIAEGSIAFPTTTSSETDCMETYSAKCEIRNQENQLDGINSREVVYTESIAVTIERWKPESNISTGNAYFNIEETEIILKPNVYIIYGETPSIYDVYLRKNFKNNLYTTKKNSVDYYDSETYIKEIRPVYDTDDTIQRFGYLPYEVVYQYNYFICTMDGSIGKAQPASSEEMTQTIFFPTKLKAIPEFDFSLSSGNSPAELDPWKDRYYYNGKWHYFSQTFNSLYECGSLITYNELVTDFDRPYAYYYKNTDESFVNVYFDNGLVNGNYSLPSKGYFQYYYWIGDDINNKELKECSTSTLGDSICGLRVTIPEEYFAPLNIDDPDATHTPVHFQVESILKMPKNSSTGDYTASEIENWIIDKSPVSRYSQVQTYYYYE